MDLNSLKELLEALGGAVAGITIFVDELKNGVATAVTTQFVREWFIPDCSTKAARWRQ